MHVPRRCPLPRRAHPPQKGEPKCVGWGVATAPGKNKEAQACSQEGQMKCSLNSTGFLTCDHGVWVHRDCAPGTACCAVDSSTVVCDLPA